MKIKKLEFNPQYQTELSEEGTQRILRTIQAQRDALKRRNEELEKMDFDVAFEIFQASQPSY